MENKNYLLSKIILILKWIFSIIFLFSFLGSLIDKAFISAVFFLLIGLLLLPTLTNFWREKIPFLKNKLIKFGALFVLLIIAFSTNPKLSKNPESKIAKSSNEMNFDDKKDIVINYVKRDSLDKTLKAIKYLGEVGELFGNGNYSLIHPDDGYITEKIDSLTKEKKIEFNPRLDFEEAKKYLNNEPKNGQIKDLVINFSIDKSGKIVSKKTIIDYSKAGKIEYENGNIPDLKSLINQKVVQNQKLNIEAEKLIAKQKAEYEKRKADFEEKCISSYDGSHRELKNLIEKNLDDPDSFEHVETLYKLFKDYAIVVMKYRAKNRFGALILTSVTAKVSLEDCSVIEIEN